MMLVKCSQCNNDVSISPNYAGQDALCEAHQTIRITKAQLQSAEAVVEVVRNLKIITKPLHTDNPAWWPDSRMPGFMMDLFDALTAHDKVVERAT